MAADLSDSATAKVLRTAELLENIVLHVQPDYIPALKCVSKSSHEIIRLSPSFQPPIKCLTPATRAFKWLISVPMPIYGQGSMIAIHPALRPHDISYGAPMLKGALSLQFGLCDLDELELKRVQAEFVTRPFCSELLIRHTGTYASVPSEPFGSRHVIYVEGGIRIGHLLKARRQLWDAVRSSNRYVTREDFVVEFGEDMSEEDMAEFKKFNKLPDYCGYGMTFELQNQWPVIKGVRKIEYD